MDDEAKKCIDCGAKIDEKVKRCGECGAKQPLTDKEWDIWNSAIVFSGFIYPSLWGLISLFAALISWSINSDRDHQKSKKFITTGVIVFVIWIAFSLVASFYYSGLI